MPNGGKKTGKGILGFLKTEKSNTTEEIKQAQVEKAQEEHIVATSSVSANISNMQALIKAALANAEKNGNEAQKLNQADKNDEQPKPEDKSAYEYKKPKDFIETAVSEKNKTDNLKEENVVTLPELDDGFIAFLEQPENSDKAIAPQEKSFEADKTAIVENPKDFFNDLQQREGENAEKREETGEKKAQAFPEKEDKQKRKIFSINKVHRDKSKGGNVSIRFSLLSFKSLSVIISLAIFYYEVILRIAMDLGSKGFASLFNLNLLYTLLLSVFIGVLLSVLCELPRKAGIKKALTLTLDALITLVFLIEFFIKQTYGNYMGVSVILTAAGGVVGSYSQMIISIIIKGLPIIALYFLPFALMLIFSKRLFDDGKSPKKDVLKKVAAAVGSLALALVMIFSIPNGYVTDRQYFTSYFNINESTSHFGLLCSVFLDAQYMITGTPYEEANSLPIYKPEIDLYEYANITQIDFNAINASTSSSVLLDMNNYFSSLAPSAKNEYTGMFKGKNLIFICAEAFTTYVIDEELTPTLYKLSTGGFVFKNYYKPSWMVSTSDGEYTLLTGLIPKYGLQSMYAGRVNNWHYTMAKSLAREGYTTMAFHDHYYKYYDRDLTHENLGYSSYMGMGNGMEAYVKEQWPESDLEMMQGTVQLYVNSENPFHIYYLTVSGHTEYNYDNSMAAKNWDIVKDMDASNPVKAIYAQNIELDRALESLLSQLEEAGKLDDTVIVMSPDHYPYGLSDSAYNELAGKMLDTNFERYHNTLILYNSAMLEPVVVEDPCYGVDVLPTLLNLFGVEYDSRLFTGSDILSSSDPLVIFQNYSWITDKGRYNADSSEFIPNEGADVPDNYVQTISNIVNSKVLYSKYILENDYYRVLYGDN